MEIIIYFRCWIISIVHPSSMPPWVDYGNYPNIAMPPWPDYGNYPTLELLIEKKIICNVLNKHTVNATYFLKHM